jgi:hypothetical protein
MLLPAVDAMASKKSEKKQDARIAKVNSRVTKVTKAAAKVTKTVATLSTSVTNQGAGLVTLTTTVGGIDARLAGIEAAAPQIIKGLGDLKTAAEGLQAGLLALQAGTTAGFDKVTATFRAVEYGVAAIYAGPTQIGVFVGSSDIPDDGNSATAAGSFPTNPTVLPADTPLTLRAVIRSNESDGGATGDPAGQVGGLMYATCSTPAGCGTVPFGAIGCSAGPPPSAPFTTPAGVLNLKLVNIQEKSSETNPTTPDADDGVLATGPSTACTIPTGGGGSYTITAQAQFFDLPTSATPANTD